MTPLRAWRARAAALFRRRQAEQDLRDELHFHLEMQARKHRAAGMSDDEAMLRARAEFGGVELAKEDARDVRGVRRIEDVVQDVRYAARVFRRAPLFAACVVVTIGLGVGIAASAFTVFDAYVLRPFDVRDPHGLYSVVWMDQAGRVHDFAPDAVAALGRPNAVLEGVVAYRSGAVRLGGIVATGDAVGTNFFDLLGVRPTLGRLLASGDRGFPVVVLSDAAWRTRFGGDSAIVGRRVLVGRSAFQVVGVAPAGFTGLFKKPRDFWIPLELSAALDRAGADSAPRRVSVIARLRRGVSEGQASAYVASVLGGTMDAGTRVARVFLSSQASPIPQTVGTYARFLPLLGAFALILLLACANVANVLLARGLARRRELGIRLALGAGRGRLVRQLVVESVVLGLPAVVVGLGLAWMVVTVGVQTLFATLPRDLAAFVRLIPLHSDWRVAVFALVATIAATLACGLTPSLEATRLSMTQATRGIFADSGPPGRWQAALVVGQVAVAALLLISASILLRQTMRLGRAEIGFRTADVVSIELQEESRARILDALRSSPVVERVATSGALPLDMRFPTVAAHAGSDSLGGTVAFNRVSPGYFELLGIPIVGGRGFMADEGGIGPIVVVSQAAARRFWPHATPIGQSLRLDLKDGDPASDPLRQYQNARVVGVARDVVVQSVESGSDVPVFYFPVEPEAPGCCALVRVSGDADAAKRAIEARLDRDVPGGVERIDRLETFVEGAVYPYRAAYWLALGLGAIALALTVVGVYGVVAYVVGRRTREIGVRIALGATSAGVLALMLRRSLRQAAIGAAIGSVAALGVSRVIAANLQGAPSFDAIAFGAAIVCVIGACAVAALIPARRAAAIDPMIALRQD